MNVGKMMDDKMMGKRNWGIGLNYFAVNYFADNLNSISGVGAYD